MNVVVLAPHPDDEALGCGGAICLHAERSDRVVVVFLTSGELGLDGMSTEQAWKVRETEAEAAADVLGVADLRFLRQPDWYLEDHVAVCASHVAEVLDCERPSLVYVPHEGEWHPDHRAASAVLAAARVESSCDPTVFAYEVWTPLAEFDQVEDISGVMERKLAAIRCYPSQAEQFSYERAITGLNQYRGALAGRCDYAEVFRASWRAAAE